MRLLPSLLLVVLGLFGTDVEQPIDRVPPSSSEQRLAFAKQAAEAYRIRFLGRDVPEAKLSPEPLLRWNNQVIREDDGFLFIWTEGDKGRPVAASQLFVVATDWHHEFQSLSANGFDARYEGDEGREWIWHPTRAGLEFVYADDIDPPVDSPFQRLRQMKSIAERFTAAVDTNEDFQSPEQLRLLTTPVYRYSAIGHTILDGAIFAFVQGTNPEILLLVEAEETGTGKAWRYGFARMSSYHLRVHRGNHLEWKKDRAAVPTRDENSPYFFRLRAQIDRSAELKLPAAAKLVN